MVIVGYGSGADGDYWIVKNSWGTDYALKGYWNIRRGVNLCSIENFAMYPILKKNGVKLDCKVSNWGSWSVCTKTCGMGEKRRYRHVTRHPSGAGKACPHLEQLMRCNMHVCPPIYMPYHITNPYPRPFVPQGYN